MISTVLLFRWFVSVVVILLLLLAFFVILRIIREHKGNFFNNNATKNRKTLNILEQVYIDPKNKIVKVKDGNSLVTFLMGNNALVLNKETVKEENGNVSTESSNKK